MAPVKAQVCKHHGCAPPGVEPYVTLPNAITLIRTALSLGLALAAAGSGSLLLLLAALAVYWIGDVLDGAAARWLDLETRLGAVLDVVCDRACALVFYVGWAWLSPDMVLPVGIYLAEFAVIDTLLSLAFFVWPLRSPNYFFLVDSPLWRWNWSKAGKAVNSSAFALLMVVTRRPEPAVVIAAMLLVVKAVSLTRLARLPAPSNDSCAAVAAGMEASQ
jgi:CDP-diacylglycerol--glycerol-3-phosphate 3-phosphatidyltransferase